MFSIFTIAAGWIRFLLVGSRYHSSHNLQFGFLVLAPTIAYCSLFNIEAIILRPDIYNNFIGFFLRFTCLYGKKFVSKSDFAVGSSANLLTELTAVCLISGWFNETVGSYTCVKDCGPPTNYSTVMTNNWDGNLTVVPYGKSFK